MKILFVHQNFPGQFKHLAAALARAGHQVRSLAIKGVALPGVDLINYPVTRTSSQGIHPWAIDFETKLIRGESCAQAALAMKREGYQPDLVLGHPGWGEMLFLREIWPRVPQLHFLEFYYSPDGADVGFDEEFWDQDWRSPARVRAKNSNGLLNLESMDAAYSPTYWQRSSYPAIYQPRIEVIHDGVDTDVLVPGPAKASQVGPDKLMLHQGMEIVTFVNRNLEPYRGYHVFMRTLPRLQKLRPNAIFLVVGGDGVSYGAAPPQGQSWKNIFLEEVKDQIDLSRVIFLGNLSYAHFINILRLSAAHIYLTYPFVLSWSMLEAMSLGALVVGSRTQPVEEVIEDQKNGLLVDFFDREGLADRVADALANPQRYLGMRQAARQTIIDRYDLKRHCLPRQMELVERVAAGKA
ncbi:glycosyltransferase family 4 protein [Niveispirillum sp. KHB5.9]|uniref:glycosyltransferase family 4 protein n=1 Tax=Niveispirillum sp. KHB5.9 TaxID=3400269 RepID=UPI003A8B3D47